MSALLSLATACAAPAPVPSPTGAPLRTARGVLLEVVSPGIQTLESFTLRTDDGRELTFVPAPDFNAGAAHVMTPGHMRQHMALADPVVVTYREAGGALIALSATDASAQ